MQCPHHPVALLKSRKHGIEIDYCPQCKGAWFDRGELDKVIEVYRSLDLEARDERRGRDDDDDERPQSRKTGRKHPLKQIADLLEDLFD